MVSMAGLEPARISPHAPQTCAYTDSATSTYCFDIQFSNFYFTCRVYLPSHKTILNCFLSWIIASHLQVVHYILLSQNCRSLFRCYFEFRDFVTHSTQNPLGRVPHRHKLNCHLFPRPLWERVRVRG